MIRFTPDTWWDVAMRPFDMISPDANIYVEVSAPDVRLAAVVLLAVAALAFNRLRASPTVRQPAFLLLLLTLVAMVPWLATTGNGRYFTPFLLLLGPLCVGLVRLLPLSTSMKFSTVGLVLLLQVGLLVENPPWDQWPLLRWREAPYFQVAQPPAEPRSYATLSPISYSLVAPQFPPESRWMNLPAPVSGPREVERARKWLAGARNLHLMAPSLPAQTEADDQPSAAVLAVFSQMIRPRGLFLVEGTRCEFLPSGGLVRMAQRQKVSEGSGPQLRRGFWLCPMRYDPSTVAALPPPDPDTEAVFAAVERLCPRFFRPDETTTTRGEGAATRHYPGSDTRVSVFDNGEVMYKFWRSLNWVTIGTRSDVLAGRVRVDCGQIRAPTWRSGGR